MFQNSLDKLSHKRYGYSLVGTKYSEIGSCYSVRTLLKSTKVVFKVEGAWHSQKNRTHRGSRPRLLYYGNLERVNIRYLPVWNVLSSSVSWSPGKWRTTLLVNPLERGVQLCWLRTWKCCTVLLVENLEVLYSSVLRQTRQWGMRPYVTSVSTMVSRPMCYARLDNGGWGHMLRQSRQWWLKQ